MVSQLRMHELDWHSDILKQLGAPRSPSPAFSPGSCASWRSGSLPVPERGFRRPDSNGACPSIYSTSTAIRVDDAGEPALQKPPCCARSRLIGKGTPATPQALVPREARRLRRTGLGPERGVVGFVTACRTGSRGLFLGASETHYCFVRLLDVCTANYGELDLRSPRSYLQDAASGFPSSNAIIFHQALGATVLCTLPQPLVLRCISDAS